MAHPAEDVVSTPDENEFPSGFPPSICDQAPREKHLCGSCGSVLNRPRRSACGHRYCLACAHWLLRNNKKPVCKKCKEEGPSTEDEGGVLTLDSQFFCDAAINKEIMELKVHCANQGCPWRGVLRDFEEHQSQCDYALIPCNVGCGHMVIRKALASHLKKGCPKNTSVCPTCSRSLPVEELQNHTCHGQGEKKMSKEEKKQKNGGSKQNVACTFSEVGCLFKASVEKVKEHECSDHVTHLQLLLEATRTFHASERGAKNTPPFTLLSRHSADDSGPPIQREVEVETDGGDGAGREEMSLACSLRDDQATILVGHQLEALQQRLQVSENVICVLNRELEKTQLCIAVLESGNQINLETIQALETKIMDQEQRLARKDMVISSLQQCVSAQQDVTYDGTFLWRIGDIGQKLKESTTGQRHSQYSPAFYTSRYGFKVGMRLYLNGDGAGKGTHLSLFFVIMKGEHDALLSWPFKHKVTFMLIDQNQRDHVCHAFRPDLTSTSFQRPMLDTNVASGCPKFFPLAKLGSPKHAYCKDNTLFIKCVVDHS
uniref:TNF receptor-associated factor n=1 Tax=Denticeps clupeoides TaxID=299321 RepID=A0AAY4F0E4_9TELE